MAGSQSWKTEYILLEFMQEANYIDGRSEAEGGGRLSVHLSIPSLDPCPPFPLDLAHPLGLLCLPPTYGCEDSSWYMLQRKLKGLWKKETEKVRGNVGGRRQRRRRKDVREGKNKDRGYGRRIVGGEGEPQWESNLSGN